MNTMQPARATSPHIDDSVPRPVVAGTDIKVAQIAFEHGYHGMAPDEIVEAHPHLTLADVHAALTYSYDHIDAIRADWAETDRVIEEMKKIFPPRYTDRRLARAAMAASEPAFAKVWANPEDDVYDRPKP